MNLVKNSNQSQNEEFKNEIMKEQTNEMELENRSNEIPTIIQDGDFEIKVPSKKWLDDYMINGIQSGLIFMIECSIEKILGDFEEEIKELWSDCDYRKNFPYKSLDEVLDYYQDEYFDELDSELIFKLKRYLKKERTKLWNVRNNWSKEEMEFEEYISN